MPLWPASPSAFSRSSISRSRAHFHAYIDDSHNAFAWRIYPPLMLARDIGIWISAVLVAPAVIALVIKLVLPRHKMLMSGRAVVFLIATMALAPGLLVNVVLKDHWGRPRPIDVKQFGGQYQFMAWWDPRGKLPQQLLLRVGRRGGRRLDLRAGRARAAALARARLWRGARLHRSAWPPSASWPAGISSATRSSPACSPS